MPAPQLGSLMTDYSGHSKSTRQNRRLLKGKQDRDGTEMCSAGTCRSQGGNIADTMKQLEKNAGKAAFRTSRLKQPSAEDVKSQADANIQQAVGQGSMAVDTTTTDMMEEVTEMMCKQRASCMLQSHPVVIGLQLSDSEDEPEEKDAAEQLKGAGADGIPANTMPGAGLPGRVAEDMDILNQARQWMTFSLPIQALRTEILKHIAACQATLMEGEEVVEIKLELTVDDNEQVVLKINLACPLEGGAAAHGNRATFGNEEETAAYAPTGAEEETATAAHAHTKVHAATPASTPTEDKAVAQAPAGTEMVAATPPHIHIEDNTAVPTSTCTGEDIAADAPTRTEGATTTTLPIHVEKVAETALPVCAEMPTAAPTPTHTLKVIPGSTPTRTVGQIAAAAAPPPKAPLPPVTLVETVVQNARDADMLLQVSRLASGEQGCSELAGVDPSCDKEDCDEAKTNPKPSSDKAVAGEAAMQKLMAERDAALRLCQETMERLALITARCATAEEQLSQANQQVEVLTKANAQMVKLPQKLQQASLDGNSSSEVIHTGLTSSDGGSASEISTFEQPPLESDSASEKTQIDILSSRDQQNIASTPLRRRDPNDDLLLLVGIPTPKVKVLPDVKEPKAVVPLGRDSDIKPQLTTENDVDQSVQSTVMQQQTIKAVGHLKEVQQLTGTTGSSSTLVLTQGAMIGRGGGGMVFEVTEAITKKQYAMKRISKEFGVTCADALLSERDNSKLVNHPYCLTTLTTFSDKDHVYLLMELLPGGDLVDVFETDKKIVPVRVKQHYWQVGPLAPVRMLWQGLDESVARHYIASLVLALQHLHSKRIVHRDLKPENVFVGADGSVRLGDLGCSTLLTEKWGYRAHGSCGTIYYAAPEQIDVPWDGYNYSVDFWALGVLMYELMTSKLPIGSVADSAETMSKRILNPNYKVWYPGYMSRDAKDLVSRLMTYNPEERLGVSGNGIADIKSHPWFKGMDWEKLAAQQILPPRLSRDTDKQARLQRLAKDKRPHAQPGVALTDKEIKAAMKLLEDY